MHIHAKVFPDWTELPNGTFEGGVLSHTGQFFFDDDIVEVINKVILVTPLTQIRSYTICSSRPLDVAVRY